MKLLFNVAWYFLLLCLALIGVGWAVEGLYHLAALVPYIGWLQPLVPALATLVGGILIRFQIDDDQTGASMVAFLVAILVIIGFAYALWWDSGREVVFHAYLLPYSYQGQGLSLFLMMPAFGLLGLILPRGVMPWRTGEYR